MQVILDRLRSVLGPSGIIEGKDNITEKAVGWSSLGEPLAILRPASTAEVSVLLKLCHEARHPVVPWGGKTGLVDGGNATGAFALSLERMNRIEKLDPIDGTMIVEAGCILQTACEAAEAQGMIFPLDLGSRGSATIGGTISTNAGGNRVLRFGMMRDMVLGLEVVLADGTILSSLNELIKNNTGYDLKQLFIGAEGTIGIVTRAVLRLRPQLKSQNVAMAGTGSFENVALLLRRLEANLGGSLSAFEVMWSEYYNLVTTAPALGRPILANSHPFYILIETLGSDPASDADRFEAVLGDLLEAGIITDAVIAKSQTERNAIWALRDDGEQVQRNGPVVYYDVSLKLSAMDSYACALRKALNDKWPAATLVMFGHLGDGNIHLIVGGIDFAGDVTNVITDMVYGELSKRGGSISAEHGIGRQKKSYLPLSRTPEEITLMRLLKTTLDPHNILNPGKVIPD